MRALHLNPHARDFCYPISPPTSPAKSSRSDSHDMRSSPNQKHHWQPQQMHRTKARKSENPNKKRHSIEALDFSSDWAYDVPSFLRTLRLHKYIDILMSQNIQFTDLLAMSEGDLALVGVSTQGARHRMYLAIEKYRLFMEQHQLIPPTVTSKSCSPGPISNPTPAYNHGCYSSLGPANLGQLVWPGTDYSPTEDSLFHQPIFTFSDEPESVNIEFVGERLLDELLDSTEDKNLPSAHGFEKRVGPKPSRSGPDCSDISSCLAQLNRLSLSHGFSATWGLPSNTPARAASSGGFQASVFC